MGQGVRVTEALAVGRSSSKSTVKAMKSVYGGSKVKTTYKDVKDLQQDVLLFPCDTNEFLLQLLV